MKQDFWYAIRSKSHVVFPVLVVLVTVVILTCPLYSGALGVLCHNAFARFCMFWCLSVCMVLSYPTRLMRPSFVAISASVLALVVGVGFYFVYTTVLGVPADAPDLFLSCLSGAILGALAGTWLIYVLEVYSDRRPPRR